MKLFVAALEFAAKKHRDQRRKDHAASPYINHPIALVQILVREADIHEEVVLAAALLHDTIEDTDTTAEELSLHFGEKISSIVMEVTDDRSLSRAERKAHQIAHAPSLSPEAALVKLADKIANLRDLTVAPPLNWTEDRKQDYCDWAKQVVARIPQPHPKLLSFFEEATLPFR